MLCLQGTPLAASRYTGQLSGDEQTVQTQRKQLLDDQAKGGLNNGEQCESQLLLLRKTICWRASRQQSNTDSKQKAW